MFSLNEKSIHKISNDFWNFDLKNKNFFYRKNFFLQKWNFFIPKNFFIKI